MSYSANIAPKDMLDREILPGYILAVGIRSGNSGDLTIRVVKKIVDSKNWRGDLVKKVRTTSGGTLQDLSKALIVPRETFLGTKMNDWITEQLTQVVWN